MKKTFTLIGSFLLFAFSGVAQQEANVQFVHNSSDNSISEVDVYFGDTLAFDNFSYRQASAFTPVDTSSDLIVSIANSGSADTSDAIYKDTLSLTDENYHLVASGVLNEGTYADNPDGRDIGFGLQAISGAKLSADDNESIDFRVLHGATDAPYIDINVSRAQKLINNMGYGEYSNYFSLQAGTYIFDVLDSASERIIHTVQIPESNITPLLGSSAVIFTSGFLDPSANQDGSSFELMAAFQDGRVDTLASANFASAQLTHNSPDPALNSMDVYINEEREVNALTFRGSTPYLQVPANDTIEIGFAPAGSSGPGDIFASYRLPLTSLTNYHFMVAGVSQPSEFPGNPEGINTNFTLLPNIGRTGVSNQQEGGDTAITAFIHGVPDAPSADISFTPSINSDMNQIENLSYLESSDYETIIAQQYDEALFTDSASGDELFSFSGDLSANNPDYDGFADSAMVTYTSGFVTDTGNLPEVQLHSVMPDGTTYTWNKQTVGVEKQAPEVDFGLGVYPNPAVDETKVSFNLDRRKDVKMTVFSNNGQMVKQIEVGEKAKGAHEKVIDLSNLKSGLYHLQLEAGESANSAKLLVR